MMPRKDFTRKQEAAAAERKRRARAERAARKQNKRLLSVIRASRLRGR
jgi:hypothetical protein